MHTHHNHKNFVCQFAAIIASIMLKLTAAVLSLLKFIFYLHFPTRI
ncbi:hypothetical protein [Candidatus Tisiphia endosymbiont of Beris chalybata]